MIRSQLKADNPCAHNEEMAGHFVEVQGPCRRHDALFVDVDARETGHIGARGDDDRLRLQNLLFAAVCGPNDDFSRSGDPACAVIGVDLVLHAA